MTVIDPYRTTIEAPALESLKPSATLFSEKVHNITRPSAPAAISTIGAEFEEKDVLKRTGRTGRIVSESIYDEHRLQNRNNYHQPPTTSKQHWTLGQKTRRNLDTETVVSEYTMLLAVFDSKLQLVESTERMKVSSQHDTTLLRGLSTHLTISEGGADCV